MQIFTSPVAIALLVLVLFALVTRWLRWRRHAPSTAPAYEAVSALLSPAERSFFGVLQQALSPAYQIFAKVRLADILQPNADIGLSRWQSAFNRITRKHIDFVLCDPASLRIVAVIELDDSTHRRLDRRTRDTFVDSALAEAGIPILRVSARQSYSPAQLRQQLESLLRPDDKIPTP